MLQNVPFPRRPRQKYLLSGPIVDPASGKGGANELLLLLMSMVFSGGVWILEGFIGVCGLCWVVVTKTWPLAKYVLRRKLLY